MAAPPPSAVARPIDGAPGTAVVSSVLPKVPSKLSTIYPEAPPGVKSISAYEARPVNATETSASTNELTPA